MNDPLPKTNSSPDVTSTSASQTLSQAGRRRRVEMLGQLEGAMRQHHDHRRRAKRLIVTSCIGTAMLFAAGLFFWQLNSRPEIGELVMDSIEHAISDPGMGEWGERVSTNTSGNRLTGYVSSNLPDVTERLVIENKTVDALTVTKFETIEDDELLAMLQESGKPAMLGMIGGRKTVVLRRSF